MAILDASNATEAVLMTLVSDQLTFSAYDPAGNNVLPNNYSYISTGSDDVQLRGTGITRNLSNEITGGSINEIDIDLSNNSFVNPDVEITNVGGVAAVDIVGTASDFFDAVLDGNDTFTGSDFNDTLKGGGGSDTMDGGLGADVIYGLDGNDRIDDDSGTNTVYGGDGADTIFSSGSGTYQGDAGNDTIHADAGTNETLDGGAGTDWLYTTHWSGDYEIDLAVNGPNTNYGNETFINFENVVAGSGDDCLQGTSGANLMYGGAGDDEIIGRAGDDSLFGGSDNDKLNGGAGDDFLYGGTGDDEINLDVKDVVGAGGGDDTAYGGAGNDEIRSTGTGNYYGGSGNDYIRAGVGTDETLDGGTGTDTVDTTHWTGNYELNLNSGDTNYGAESFVNFENAVTGSGDDEVIGTSGANTLTLGAGEDRALGGGGGDLILGGDDNDTLFGQAGDDLLYGQVGSDTMYGGAGDDLLVGFNGSDKLRAQKGDDDLYGGNGNDTFQFKEDEDTNTIYDWTDGSDKIRIWDYDFDDLTITQVGLNTEIEFGATAATTTTIVALNSDADDFTAADFIFT